MERDPMSQAKTTRFVALGLIIMALCALSLVACSAATQTKQGGPGEICLGQDTDCRPGLLCENSVYVLPDSALSAACIKSCDKIGSCGLENLNCVNECMATVDDWSESVVEKFADCLSEDLSCEELGQSAETAAQVCYDRLETDSARLDRCRGFKSMCLPATRTRPLRRLSARASAPRAPPTRRPGRPGPKPASASTPAPPAPTASIAHSG